MEEEINVRQIQLSVQVCSPDDFKPPLFTQPSSFIIILDLSWMLRNALFFTVYSCIHFRFTFLSILAVLKVQRLTALVIDLPQHRILAITPCAADLSCLVSHLQLP